jgi:predicted nucleic acid-binding protein
VYVLDATPLIYLAKAGSLDVLDGFDVVTTEGVHEEVVVDGKKAEAHDARRVERYGVEVRETPDSEVYRRLSGSEKLSNVDAEVPGFAHAEDATAVMDERRGRTVAKVEGIDVRGTAFLLLRSVKNGEKTAEEARVVLDGMVDAGWYCSTSFYSDILGKLDEITGE